MKVKELIQILEEMSPEREVFLSSDDEGNSYRKLDSYSDNSLLADDDEIYMYDLDWSAGDCCMDDDEWESFKQTASRVVILG